MSVNMDTDHYEGANLLICHGGLPLQIVKEVSGGQKTDLN